MRQKKPSQRVHSKETRQDKTRLKHHDPKHHLAHTQEDKQHQLAAVPNHFHDLPRMASPASSSLASLPLPPLPAEWVEYWSDDAEANYYYNAESGETT